MKQLLKILAVLGIVSMFILPATVLQLIGWDYLSAGASAITKIHPSLYLLLLPVGLGLFSGNENMWAILRRPAVLLYVFATLVITVRGVQIAASGVTGGELSIAIVTYNIPLLTILALTIIDAPLRAKLAVALQVFFIINSVMAIAEQGIGYRLLPSFLDAFGNEHRSSALMGHPLLGAMFTGLYLVHLASSGRRDALSAPRIMEIILHTAAMFAYGGRSALIFTAVTIALSGLFARGQFSSQRWLSVILLVTGLIFVFLPIPLVDTLIDRFTNDQGSAETRAAAIRMLSMLTPNELLYGVPGPRRVILQGFLHTEVGIELSWVALTVTYGLLAVIPMMIALPMLLFSTARRLERSAFYMALQFLVVTAGSQGLAGKGTLIAQLLIMMQILAQPTRFVRQQTIITRTRPTAHRPEPPVAGPRGADLN